MSLEPVPFTHALDEFLHDVVRALHAAVTRGIAAARSDPKETDHALADCQEMIDLVMAGKVEDWVGEGGTTPKT